MRWDQGGTEKTQMAARRLISYLIPHQRVVGKIRATVTRTLERAEQDGMASITIPPISGGMFCHQENGEPSESEQYATRLALVYAVLVLLCMDMT